MGLSLYVISASLNAVAILAILGREVGSKIVPSKRALNRSAPLRSAPPKSALYRFAPRSFVSLRSALRRIAPLRSAPLGSTPRTCASLRSAPCSFAPLRSASRRIASRRSAPYRIASRRIAPLRSAWMPAPPRDLTHSSCSWSNSLSSLNVFCCPDLSVQVHSPLSWATTGTRRTRKRRETTIMNCTGLIKYFVL